MKITEQYVEYSIELNDVKYTRYSVSREGALKYVIWFAKLQDGKRYELGILHEGKTEDAEIMELEEMFLKTRSLSVNAQDSEL